jgi:outer membrane immunogenic protein
MRKFLLGTAALMALASPAISADMRLPVTKAPPPVVPVWNWSGCYVGGHAGGLWANSGEWIVRTPGGDFFGQSLGEHGLNGWVGGAQAGCDYQFAGGFVIGVQGDYAVADAEGSHDSAREIGVAYHSKIKSLASVTGRIGYGWDRFLGYVKGGGAWERDNYWATTIILGTAYTARETRSGWTIGVGGEYAFTNFLSGFVEYSYYDFGERHWPHAANSWIAPGICRYQSHHERRARRSQLPLRRLDGSGCRQVTPGISRCSRSRLSAKA